MTLAYWLVLLRRRWAQLLIVSLLVAIVSGVFAVRTYLEHRYAATVGLYVVDLASPAVSPSTSGQALPGDLLSNVLGDDVADIARSRAVAGDVSRYLRLHGVRVSADTVKGAIDASRVDRTVMVTATDSDKQTALAIARGVAIALTQWRARYLGTVMATESYSGVINSPTVGRSSVSPILQSFVLRVILGLVVAAGLAIAWDFLDDTVRNDDELERWLDAPVLARVGRV